MKKKFLILAFLTLLYRFAFGHEAFQLISPDKPTRLYYSGQQSVVFTAIDILVGDSEKAAPYTFVKSPTKSESDILIGVLGENQEFDQLLASYGVNVTKIKGQWEAFQLQTVKNGKKTILLVIGSDPRAAAYGTLELSRLMGISPWNWWADVTPRKKQKVELPVGYLNIQKPSVQYRGIFLNDEDWGLNPWSGRTFEPQAKVKSNISPAATKNMQTIGPRTYARIFELLLRLRANTIWPAMHEVTVPFYFVEGNRETAEKYGIMVGDAQVMARNSATEWDIDGKGNYNYVSNKENVLSFWEQRLRELKYGDNIFTLGMRGKHDSAMQGIKTIEEYRDAVNLILKDQTALLSKYIAPDPSTIPQIVIPYKEMLDVYKAGLKVPDYVSLIWCDDNFGYITHFPDKKEKQRSGGNGVYYHLSYWGSPNDYLWLSTTNPALISQQMNLAYAHQMRKIWIVNVGDIKPCEYQSELFLDMAWDINKVNEQGLDNHLLSWLTTQFGARAGRKLLPLMLEHYRLAFIRKPEFMANTRGERQANTTVRDLPWDNNQIKVRLNDYNALDRKVGSIKRIIAADRRDAFFELVEYPIRGAANMNRKMLHAQLARHGSSSWATSHRAFDSIVSMTKRYNNIQGGKWKYMMDYKPRNLIVFEKVKESLAKNPSSFARAKWLFNGTDFKGESIPLPRLGCSGKAVQINQGKNVHVDFNVGETDSIQVEVCLLPVHPSVGDHLRFLIGIEGQPTQEVSYQTKWRSKEWEENVLRNQAKKTVTVRVPRKQPVRLSIVPVDEGVILDQVLIYDQRNWKTSFDEK